MRGRSAFLLWQASPIVAKRPLATEKLRVDASAGMGAQERGGPYSWADLLSEQRGDPVWVDVPRERI